MITADALKTLVSFSPRGLSDALHHSGYTGAFFKSSEFLGITNSGEFCYSVTFPDENGEGDAVGKVFLTYDPTDNKVSAEY